MVMFPTLEGMPQYGGVILRHVLRLPQRQVRLISSIWDDFVFLDPALFLDSWIVVIFPFLELFQVLEAHFARNYFFEVRKVVA